MSIFKLHALNSERDLQVKSNSNWQSPLVSQAGYFSNKDLILPTLSSIENEGELIKN